MAKDKFKSVAAAFQIFKDGEAISARKLDGIIKKTQEGSEKIQRSLGDLSNQGLAFSGLQLFQNSIARSIGPADATTIAPIRVFDTPQDLDSRDRGLVRFPYSTAVAPDAGNRSQNILPLIGQNDKIGVGCTNDNGSSCNQRFDLIYDTEKNLLDNGLFDLQLSGWEVSGVIFDGDIADMSSKTRYNALPYSEDFFQWTMISGELERRAFDNPNGGSNAQGFNSLNLGTNLVSLSLDSGEINSSTDWCFSVYMATSGTQATVFLEIDGATHVRGTQEWGAIDPASSIYAVDISGTTWNRYYVYGTTVAKTSGVAKIHLSRGNVTSPLDKIYLWGAQLE